jgi:hypothetical protein
MKIAFLSIATNKYIHYVNNLYTSLNEHAFSDNPDYEVSLIVFSNQNPLFKQQRIAAITSDITHVPFPLISLLRYHYYYNVKEQLAQFDYVYHLDCDLQFVKPVSTEILGERVCVEHPGVNKDYTARNLFPYDLNPASKAYVPPHMGTCYYQNCLQGGTSFEFIKMCTELKDSVEIDLRSNYIARWHDESYMNRYMAFNAPTMVLPKIYAYPEKWDARSDTKIIHLDKNHLELRRTD